MVKTFSLVKNQDQIISRLNSLNRRNNGLVETFQNTEEQPVFLYS